MRPAIRFKRYLSALMRWEREWRRGVTDVENLVFPWHRHTVSKSVVNVKRLVMAVSGQQLVVGCPLSESGFTGFKDLQD